jgi:hypothetical protein
MIDARWRIDSNRRLDGMYAAFEDPADTLRATVALQCALANPTATEGIALHVRCGFHSGTVEPRESDFFGSAVNRAAPSWVLHTVAAKTISFSSHGR